MFDYTQDRRGTLAAAEANLAVRLRADGELLELAAHWADLHAPESLPPPGDEREERRRQLAGEVPARLGGEGTPLVLACCPDELGLVLQTTSGGASHLIADALDLRHRLPALWQEVQAGRVRAWKARHVAQATRRLTLEQVRDVDAGILGVVTSMAWSRFETILEATIAAADPEGARAAEREAAARRFVAVGRADDHHVKTLIARGDALDIVSFLATVHRIAEILLAEGDPDGVDVRRSKAVGILAHPRRALDLLDRHSTGPGTGETDERQAGGTGSGTGSPDQAASTERETWSDEPEDVTSSDLTAGGEPDPDGDGHTSLLTDRSDTAGEVGRCTCGPRVQLHVHLTDAALAGADPRAVGRVDGVGPVTAATVRHWLQRPDLQVTLRPTLVPGQAVPADSYEIPTRIRQALAARNPGSVYPWSPSTSPREVDHTIPYRPVDRGGPPGQTNLGNLAPLVRAEHNGKTFGHIRQRQPAPGVYLWRARHGWVFLTTNQGTFPLGNTPTAQALWDAAAPPGTAEEAIATSPSRLERLVIDFLYPLSTVALHDVDARPG